MTAADRRPGAVSPRTPRLGEFLAHWLADVIQPGTEPATFAFYETMTRRYIVPALGSWRLDQLQTSDVQAWLDRLARTCQCCAQGKDASRPEARRRCCAAGRCCRGYPSRRTLQAVRNTLRAALNHARADRLVLGNVAAYARVPGAAQPRRRSPVWRAAEARRFVASARADGDPLYAAYLLMLASCLRRGEVLGLTWSSVDLDAGRLTPAWQLQRVRGALIHKQRPPLQARGPADILLPGICTAALLVRGAQQAIDCMQAGDRWHDSDLVFTTRLGTPLDPRNLSRSFDARCAAAGVPRIRLSDLWKTCAALLAALRVRQHVTARIVRRPQAARAAGLCSRVPDAAVRAALDKLGDSLGAQPGPQELA